MNLDEMSMTIIQGRGGGRGREGEEEEEEVDASLFVPNLFVKKKTFFGYPLFI